MKAHTIYQLQIKNIKNTLFRMHATKVRETEIIFLYTDDSFPFISAIG